MQWELEIINTLKYYQCMDANLGVKQYLVIQGHTSEYPEPLTFEKGAPLKNPILCHITLSKLAANFWRWQNFRSHIAEVEVGSGGITCIKNL